MGVVQRFSTFHVDASTIIERPDGAIVVQGQITHPGVFKYTQGGRDVFEYRPENEVFSPKSMASFEEVPLTLDHPRDARGLSRRVTAKTWKEDAVGWTKNVRREGQNVVADLVVMDAATVDAIKRRALKELSCGYTLEVDPTPGVTPDGQRYDAVHKNILGNHVALLPVGRARGGPECVLRVDGNEEFPGAEVAPPKSPNDGTTLPADPSLPSGNRTMTVSEAEFATAVARADSLAAENATLKAQLSDETRLDSLVEERAMLVTAAKAEKIETKGLTNRQIKAKIVAARSPSLAARVDSLEPSALDAAFTVVMDRPAPAASSSAAFAAALAGVVTPQPGTRTDSAAPGGSLRAKRLQNQAELRAAHKAVGAIGGTPHTAATPGSAAGVTVA